MRLTTILTAAIFAFSAPIAFAQTAPAPAATTPALTKDGKPKAKEVRAACKTEAESKSIAKGEPRKAFMRECIGKQRPDLVKAFDCRKEAKEKNLDKDARKAFMKECRAK